MRCVLHIDVQLSTDISGRDRAPSVGFNALCFCKCVCVCIAVLCFNVCCNQHGLMSVMKGVIVSPDLETYLAQHVNELHNGNHSEVLVDVYFLRGMTSFKF